MSIEAGLPDIPTKNPEHEENTRSSFQISEDDAPVIDVLIEDFAVRKSNLAQEIINYHGGFPSTRYMRVKQAPSPLDHKLLYFLSSGMSNNEMATEASITEQTVKNHITAINGAFASKSRLETVDKAIKGNLVEPLLISTDADLSLLPSLSPTEKLIYDQLTAHSAFNKKEIVNNLSMDERSVKNHASIVMQKLRIGPNIIALYMYERKRQEAMLSFDGNFSHIPPRLIFPLRAILKIDQSNFRYWKNEISPHGIFSEFPFQKEGSEIYKKFSASNLIECCALGLIHGLGDLEEFATPVTINSIKNLSKEDLEFISASNLFHDTANMSIRSRFFRLGTNRYKSHIKSLLRRNSLNSFFQASVLVEYNRLLKSRERQKLKADKIAGMREQIQQRSNEEIADSLTHDQTPQNISINPVFPKSI